MTLRNSEESKSLIVRCKMTLLEELDKLAKKKGLGRSEYVRSLIAREIKIHRRAKVK